MIGEPVTITTRTQTGTDAYGSPIYATTSITRRGVFAPSTGVENVNGEDRVVSQPQVLFTGQAAADVAAIVDSSSQVTVRGRAYEVDGEPADWRFQFSGRRAGVQVPLKRTTGAG